MSKITYIGGDLIEEIGGSYTIFAKEGYEITAMKQIIFNAKEGIQYGEPESPPVVKPEVSDNAFIPVVNIDEASNNAYESRTNNSTWTLSEHIQQDLRKQKSKNIKFKTEDKIVKVKFNVSKGNPNANDNDGGNITAKFFDIDDEFIESKVFEDVNYGESFELEWDKTKNIGQIDFYADDNDIYFDGGVSKVFCGAIEYGSKVGRTLTKNIEDLPSAPIGYKAPPLWTNPEQSFKVANKYQDCKGMCFAVSMKRVEKAYLDCSISDAITVTTKGDDYVYSGTVSKNIPDLYFGYGVGGTLAKNGYAELLIHEEVWGGKLEEGAMLQYWGNYNNRNWQTLKSAIKSSIGANQHQDFSGGHSIIFKSYKYDTNGDISGIKYYDYSGIHKEFSLIDKQAKIILGANLKDYK